MTDPKDKPAWRERMLASRASVPPQVAQAEAAALATWVRSLRDTVCAYYPVGTEPGSVSMLDALVAAGCRVLLPVVAVRGAPLDWAEYRADASGGLVRAPYGLLEPVGPRLGATALSAAATMLVPALAVDRRGIRLGRGAGYYDRTLVLASPGTALVGVVRDSELVERLPAEEHDVPMTAVLTPGAGFTGLPVT